MAEEFDFNKDVNDYFEQMNKAISTPMDDGERNNNNSNTKALWSIAYSLGRIANEVGLFTDILVNNANQQKQAQEDQLDRLQKLIDNARAEAEAKTGTYSSNGANLSVKK